MPYFVMSPNRPRFFNYSYSERQAGISPLDLFYSGLITHPSALLTPADLPVTVLPPPASLPANITKQPPTRLSSIDVALCKALVDATAPPTNPQAALPTPAVPWVIPYHSDDVSDDAKAVIEGCVTALSGPVEQLLVWYSTQFL